MECAATGASEPSLAVTEQIHKNTPSGPAIAITLPPVKNAEGRELVCKLVIFIGHR